MMMNALAWYKAWLAGKQVSMEKEHAENYRKIAIASINNSEIVR